MNTFFTYIMIFSENHKAVEWVQKGSMFFHVHCTIKGFSMCFTAAICCRENRFARLIFGRNPIENSMSRICYERLFLLCSCTIGELEVSNIFCQGMFICRESMVAYKKPAIVCGILCIGCHPQQNPLECSRTKLHPQVTFLGGLKSRKCTSLAFWAIVRL